MSEFNERILRKFRRDMLLIGVGIIVLVITNMIMLYEAYRAVHHSELSVLLANQSASSAGAAFNQSSLNMGEIQEHAEAVKKHSNETRNNHVEHATIVLKHLNISHTNSLSLLNNTELIKNNTDMLINLTQRPK